MSPDSIKEVLASELDVAEESLSLTRTDTGRYNQTWFVSAPDLEGDRVIRIAPPPDQTRVLFYEHRMMRQEPAIHALLLKATACPVPEILAIGWDDTRFGGRDFLIMDRLPGEPISWSTESVMTELGACLRQVHDRILAPPDQYGYLGEHRPMEPQVTWQAAFLDMWQRLLDDIRTCGGYGSEEDRFYRKLLDQFINHFDHFQEPAPLMHMDVWAENILTDSGGRLTGLVDWDRACWGDPEIEYAILDYCGISTPGFWQGYSTDGQDPRSDDPEAAIRRIFYLLYEIQKYIVIRIARNEDPDGAERYRQIARDLAAQLP